MIPTAPRPAGTHPGGHALRAAVIGSPIGHSKSPALHRAAYRVLGFDCSYEAIEVSPQDLPAFVDTVRAGGNWRGVSVTMPHKAALVPLVDLVTGHAAALGVLNTVTVDSSGEKPILTGHNTDVAGIVGALRHAGVTGAPHRAAILGGGGTAAAALAALKLLGAIEATVYVRSVERAAHLRDLGRKVGLTVMLSDFTGAVDGLLRADVAVSTLPPHGADSLARELLGAPSPPTGGVVHPARVLLDVAYEPWPSPLATAWETHGGVIVPGLEMLIYQAVEQVRLFSGAGLSDPAAVLKVMCDAVGAPPR